MKNFIEFVRDNDSYGSEKKFKVNKKEKFQTFCGGILTLIVYFIFLFKFFSLVRSWFLGENPQISFSEVFEPKNPIRFNSGENLLKLHYAQQFGWLPKNITDYFYISATYVDYRNGTSLPLHQYHCGDKFGNKTSMCIDVPKNKYLELTGTFIDFTDSEPAAAIYISANFCLLNQTSKSYYGCKKEELKEFVF